MTNADRIRIMDDIELANFLADNEKFSPCQCCDYHFIYNNNESTRDSCHAPNGFLCVKQYAAAMIKIWLEKESEETGKTGENVYFIINDRYIRLRKSLIQLLEECADNPDEFARDEELFEALKKLVGKQKPQIPELWGDGVGNDGEIIYDMYNCPNCGKSYEIDYEEYRYCPECGQAIDWSWMEPDSQPV